MGTPVGMAQQQHRTRAIDQDIPDGVGGGDHAFPQRRSRLHHPRRDAAREVVLKEAPALPRDMPVVLPADEVGHAGVDRLVGDEVLHQQGRGAHHQQHADHQQQLAARFGDQRLRRVVGDERDDSPDEHRDRHVEDCDCEACRKQRRHQPGRLTHEMPVEAGQGVRLIEGGWRLVGVDLGGLQPGFEKTEHALGVDPMPGDINP
jgi:hypothetical protein